MLTTDFWWLSSEEARQYGYIELFRQEPYSDEPDTDRDPCSCPMFSSDQKYPLEFVSQWKSKFRKMNVFRSYALYSSDTNGEEIIGPFLLDIDRLIEQDDRGLLPDFERALNDTRLLVKEYCSCLRDDDYRIFFTGHKGFHIEIRPGAIDVQPYMDRRQYFRNRRKEVNNRFGKDFTDPSQEHIRLHNSINVWIDRYGQRVYRMNFEVSLDELFSLSAEEISSKASKLALGVLDI